MRNRIPRKRPVCRCTADGIRYADGHFYPHFGEREVFPVRKTTAPSDLKELSKLYCRNGKHSLKLSEERKAVLHTTYRTSGKVGVLTRRVVTTRGSKTVISANPREAQQACISIQNINRFVDSILEHVGF